MLCMLLNIRSKSDYEKMRSMQFLPLPCTKTIREYMSLVDLKCGFDDNFFKLLKKAFTKREMIKKKTFHGVITIDEMSLRTSISVKSKTLSYSGLVNMGEDGQQSSNIDDLADHGLVVQFQSLNDKFTQPVAVFASKNSVHGHELAKIVIKSICMLENAGAKIHGIIADGASTNRKMWSCLGNQFRRDKPVNKLHPPIIR